MSLTNVIEDIPASNVIPPCCHPDCKPQEQGSGSCPPNVTHVDRHQRIPNNSFYKRTLPTTCIPFNSPKGRQLFSGSLAEGHLESYFSLSLQFLTQAEPAFCGLSTLCMVLNALEIDPGRQWKGSCWRWYDETMLDCCRPLEEVMQNGITLPEFVCLSRCNGLKATLSRADRSTKESFLRMIERTSREPKEFLVVSYDRGTLQQTGTGHFSPIGGFNAAENMVLILDVARFKYPAYWVSLDLLWQSLHPLDTSTGKPRGYVVLQKGSRGYIASALSQLAVTSDSWPRLSNILFHELPSRFVTSPPTSPADFIKTVVESIPDSYDSVVENRLPLFVSPSSVSDPSDEVPAAAASSEEGLKGPENGPVSAVAFDTYVSGLDDLLHKLANTDLYRLVEASIAARNRTRQREALMAMAAAASAKAAARMRRENEEKISSGPPGLSRVRSSERLIDDAEKISSPPMSPRYHLNYAGSLLSRRSSANLSGGMSPERRRLSLSLCQTHFHPANHPVNDFTAFLTIFLFALFSYKPWHEELLDVQEEPDERKSQTDLSKDLPTKPAPVRSEPTVKCSRRLSMAEQVRGLVNLDVAGIQESVIREEVAFLRNQIAALTELQLQDSRRNGTDVAPTST